MTVDIFLRYRKIILQSGSMLPIRGDSLDDWFQLFFFFQLLMLTTKSFILYALLKQTVERGVIC